jgi:uncharacterized LabA/DUF88 family protein
MPAEPAIKRTTAFVDGQNVFYAAKEAFGYTYPNYDVKALAEALCRQQGWQLDHTRFYTGIPHPQDHARWHHFWMAKLRTMSWQGTYVYSRPLRYRNQSVELPNGTVQTVLVGEEKGIDVRIALDVIRFAYESACDVLLIFSQDQDLSEVADEVRRVARLQQRWLKMACAFPSSPTSRNSRGINNTDWIKIDRATYDRCLDPRDYRPKKPGETGRGVT